MSDLPNGTILRYVESKSSHGVTLSIGQFIEWGVLVPVEVDRGFISRAIIAELDRRCTDDVPPGRHEWARRDFENVLTDDEGLPRMSIFEISDVVLAALGIGDTE